MQLGLAVGLGGGLVYMPPGGLSGQPYGTLFGRPVIAIEQAASLGDKGDVLLADMNQYVLADKGGIQSAVSMHVRFTNDETVIRFVYRVDGQPLWHSALTPFKGTSNTLSPFVTLDARA
jgi:HK97 family phage major capsid protein